MRVFLASRNQGKAREIAAILEPAGLFVFAPPEDWEAPEETGETYMENALIKAQSLSAFAGDAAVADDSGIEVDALDGAPGVYSARFAGPSAGDAENLAKLIESIRDVPAERRTARYRCVAILVAPGYEPVVAEGTVEGTLVTKPRGDGGFGYDPIFVPAGEGRTMAELPPHEKDAISHRGMAFRRLVDAL